MGGIDFSVWKIKLCAIEAQGSVTENYVDLNLQITKTDKPLINEVKKVGVIIDRGQELQVRGGDVIIVYVCMGGFQK